MFTLSSEAKAQKYRLDYHERVTSTNILAAEYAKSGDAGRLWLVAGEQMQGKGRRGRVWHSPFGNLYASLLLLEDIRPERAATLGFVAGVSLVEAIVAVSPPGILEATTLQLKWPNDVLLNGAKLAGILLEQFPKTVERLSDKNCSENKGMERFTEPGEVNTAQERLIWPKLNEVAMVIGMGLNVAHAPEAEFYPTACLNQHGFDITPAQLFERLSHFWTQNFALWNRGDGLDKIRQKWLQYAAGLGDKVHVLVNDIPVDGIFETIDAQCQLVIKTKDGRRHVVPAGDVHFGTVKTFRAHNS